MIRDQQHKARVYSLDLEVLAQRLGVETSTLVEKLMGGEEEEQQESPSMGPAATPRSRRAVVLPGQCEVELLDIDGVSLICRLLGALEHAGCSSVEAADPRAEVAAHVRDAYSGELTIDIVEAPRGGVLVMRADHLFDTSLLSSFLALRTSAVLVDDEMHQQGRERELAAGTVVVRTVEGRVEAIGAGIARSTAVFAGLARVSASGSRSFFARLRKKRLDFEAALEALVRSTKVAAIFADGRSWAVVDSLTPLDETQLVDASASVDFPSASEASALVGLLSEERRAGLEDDINDSRQIVDFELRPPDIERALSVEEPAVIPGRYAVVAVNDDDVGDDDDDDDARQENMISVPALARTHEGAMLATVADATYALVPEADVPRTEPPPGAGVVSTLLATAGVEDVHDLHAVTFRRGATLELVVDRRVPLFGWGVVLLSTATQASAFLAASFLDRATPVDDVYRLSHLLAFIFWRTTAAAIVAAPLVLLRRLRRRGRPPPKPPPPKHELSRLPEEEEEDDDDDEVKKATPVQIAAQIARCVVLFSLSFFVYTISFKWARHTSDVYLMANMRPLFVILFRFLGILSDRRPTPNELVGATIGAIGAGICASAAPDKPQLAVTAPRPLLVFVLVVAYASLHASYDLALKPLTRHAAPIELQLATQAGCALLSLCALLTWDDDWHLYAPGLPPVNTPAATRKRRRRVFSFDRVMGAFSFLSPTWDRLGVSCWTGVVSDTLGTLGSTIAIKYVDPLVISVAALFQPSLELFEAWGVGTVATPAPWYGAGVVVLVSGAVIICGAANRTQTTVVSADDAVVDNLFETTPARISAALRRQLGFTL